MQIEYEDDFLPDDEELGEFQPRFNRHLIKFKKSRDCLAGRRILVSLYDLMLEYPAILATSPEIRGHLVALCQKVLDATRARALPLKPMRRLRIQYRKFFDSLRVLDIWEK
jgi:hypothetical protein